MARQTKKTEGKKSERGAKSQTFEEWFANSVNKVLIVGVVKRIVISSDKVLKICVDTVKETPNGKYAHSFITCTTFNEDVDVSEGDEVIIEGWLQTNSYNGKYSTEVIFDELLDDIP